LYEYSISKPQEYWEKVGSRLYWFDRWKNAYKKIKYRGLWFEGGTTNICYNSIDIHSGTAIIWQSEEGKIEEFSYSESKKLVETFSNFLINNGLKKGDKISIYMPNIPETLFMILGAARIGVIYSLIFAGLGSEAVKSRILDFSPSIIISTNYTIRRGNKIPLYTNLSNFVIKRENLRDFLYKYEARVQPTAIEANEPLKVMYTSGTSGKPKGAILPHGAWMVGDYSVFNVMFNLKPKDIVLTTADVGWITFSRIFYGTLLHGATFAFLEGAPDYPKDRLVRLIDELKPKLFFTSPTLLRTLMKYDIRLPRVEYLATAGEIFDEASWRYAQRFADKVSDVYGQTELGYVVGTPYSLEGVEARPGYAGVPLPGAVIDVVDDLGNSIKDKVGYVIAKEPFPTQFIGIYNNESKYMEYFSKFGYHNTGDLGIMNGNYLKIVGREDDMIKIAGHRITSGEVEDIVSKFPGVIEAAAVSVPDEIKGERLVLFIVGDVDVNILREKVRELLGPIYIIDKIYKVERLPKSKSGKVVRRILRDLLIGKTFDSTILEDAEVIKEIIKAIEWENRQK
jgi:acetyl-CoA synthetase